MTKQALESKGKDKKSGSSSTDPWFIYMARCSDSTLYTGIAKDPAKRIKEHNSGPDGAKYTKARRPVTLVWHEACVNRSEATKREGQLKRLSREKKLQLVAGFEPENLRK